MYLNVLATCKLLRTSLALFRHATVEFQSPGILLSSIEAHSANDSYRLTYVGQNLPLRGVPKNKVVFVDLCILLKASFWSLAEGNKCVYPF